MTSSASAASRLVPVILAGGSGTRLWPVSRAAFPKHLVELFGEESLLQATVRRVLHAAAPERVVTVTAAGQAVLVRRQLQAIDESLLAHILPEPSARNTAAAIALAALPCPGRVRARRILWVCPSDHVMQRPEALHAALAEGLPAADAGWIVTFGITPLARRPASAGSRPTARCPVRAACCGPILCRKPPVRRRSGCWPQAATPGTAACS